MKLPQIKVTQRGNIVQINVNVSGDTNLWVKHEIGMEELYYEWRAIDGRGDGIRTTTLGLLSYDPGSSPEWLAAEEIINLLRKLNGKD